MAYQLQNEDYIIIKANEPYDSIKEIIDYNITYTGEGTFTSMFRWSLDGLTFSDWFTLSLENLDKIRLPKFWIQYKIKMTGGDSITIEEISLGVTYILATPKYFNPTTSVVEQGSLTSPWNLNNFTFNPYDVITPGLQINQELSLMTNRILGHDVTYYRYVPQLRSADAVLREYGLFEYDKSRCIKVMVPGNDFPQDVPQYNMFGVEFEQPFVVDVDKKYFEESFGVGNYPQKRDLLYFPLRKALYEVGGSYPVRGFMQNVVFWKVSLIKAQQKSTRLPSDIDATIKGLITDSQELFKEVINDEISDTINNPQFTYATNVNDYNRDFLDYDLVIPEVPLVNYFTTISEHYYDLSSRFTETSDTEVVTYKNNFDMGTSDDRMFAFWFKWIDYKTRAANVTNSSLTDNSLTFNYGRYMEFNVGDWLSIYNTTNNITIGRITSIDDLSTTVTIEIPTDLLTALPVDWHLSTSLRCKKSIPRTMVYSRSSDDVTGIKVVSFENKFIQISFNTQVYYHTVALSADKWYSIVVNISNTFKQLTVHVWKMKDATFKTTLLDLVYSNQINFTNNITVIGTDVFKIYSSPLYLTNFRVFKNTIEEDKQSSLLNQMVVRDASLALIIDNAIPQSRLPYIGTPK